jgi:hypothetical protein
VLERRDVRGGETRPPERDAEPAVSAGGGGAAAELERERAAGHHPAQAGQPEDGRGGNGPEGRPPRFPREERDVVGMQPAAQQGGDRRLGLARRVEERDEQDLGRAVEGAHDSLSATKK